MGELVVADGHEADQFRIALGKGFRQNADSIDEIVGVAFLVAETEKGDFLARHVDRFYFRQKLVPVGRQFSVEPGGSSGNDVVERFEFLACRSFDRDQDDFVFSERFLYFQGDYGCFSGCATIE